MFGQKHFWTSILVEAELSTKVGFSSVPTEANISDFPSRLSPHPFLSAELECSDLARDVFCKLKDSVVHLKEIHEEKWGG